MILSVDSQVFWDLFQGITTQGYLPEVTGFGLRFNHSTGKITGSHSVVLKVPEATPELLGWVQEKYTDLEVPGRWRDVIEMGVPINVTYDTGERQSWRLRSFGVDSLSLDEARNLTITFSAGSCDVHIEFVDPPKTSIGKWALTKS